MVFFRVEMLNAFSGISGFARERERERVMGEWIPGDRSLVDREERASLCFWFWFCFCGVAMIFGGGGGGTFLMRGGGGEEDVKSITIGFFAALFLIFVGTGTLTLRCTSPCRDTFARTLLFSLADFGLAFAFPFPFTPGLSFAIPMYRCKFLSQKYQTMIRCRRTIQ